MLQSEGAVKVETIRPSVSVLFFIIVRSSALCHWATTTKKVRVVNQRSADALHRIVYIVSAAPDNNAYSCYYRRLIQYAVRCLLIVVTNKCSGFCRQGVRVMLTRAKAIKEKLVLSETGVSVG